MIRYLFLCVALTLSAVAAELKTPGDKMFADYFRRETAKVSARSLADIKTLEDWNARKGGYRQQLFEMLGLDPLPPKTKLNPTVTGVTQHEAFEVRKLHFQSMPGLYVTANLYVPKNLTKPAPTILYVCGHALVKTNQVSFGNKAGYQHHGAWFARHGYVCLTIDTLQLGEIEGIHHGTHNKNMWWWNSRGYSSAGVEAWNCIRALDFLETQDFVDKTRIGVTGRSGGGAYSWWIAALDERIQVAAPVAGITDLQNHVVDGVVEGHCDCMFHVNTYGWDFAQVAALVAPRPLLILNTDDDRIFPLDGVVRVFNQVRRIYELHGAKDKLGLVITPGGHLDTQELRVPAFRWFDKHLLGQVRPIEVDATKLFTPPQLKVFADLPKDERNTVIQETFTRRADESYPLHTDRVLADLRLKTFGGWPQAPGPLGMRTAFETRQEGVVFSGHDFTSQDGVQLRLYLAAREGLAKPERIHLEILGEEEWQKYLQLGRPAFAAVWAKELEQAGIAGDAPVTPQAKAAMQKQMEHVRNHAEVYAVLLPRGVGLTALTRNERHLTHTRRRFMLLGQTLAGMQVWDVQRGIEALRTLPQCKSAPLDLWGYNGMASQTALAAVFAQGVAQIHLKGYPATDKEQPDYLNISRILTPAQVLQLTRQRTKVNLLDAAKK
ncbi:MAG: acetylxylan esterase [Pedosphaera sp.]|nr:acetylxylan esterase [Pedosphaera sp.]MSU42999.1 acetylxylan esterase [Pedosphaera sp.]